jgi:hypothetical protein
MNKNQSFDDFRGRDKNRTKNIKERQKKMLGRLMTEWLTSSAQCEEAPEKVRLLKSEREDREFLLFFFSLSTLRERDFLKRGGSRDG